MNNRPTIIAICIFLTLVLLLLGCGSPAQPQSPPSIQHYSIQAKANSPAADVTIKDGENVQIIVKSLDKSFKIINVSDKSYREKTYDYFPGKLKIGDSVDIGQMHLTVNQDKTITITYPSGTWAYP